MNQEPCTTCSWDIRGSDRYCSFCGTLQRKLDSEPAILTLGGEQAAAGSSVPVSAGRTRVTSRGPLPVRIFAVESPPQLQIATDPPLPGNGGLLLPLERALQLEASQAVDGDLPASGAQLSIRTSIGTFHLPIRNEPPPQLHLDPPVLQLPLGSRRNLELQLQLEDGHHRVRLRLEGSGLRLLEPVDETQISAGAKLKVRIEADPELCLEPAEPARLLADFGWTTVALVPQFEPVQPGRLLVQGGHRNVDLRVFPGEQEERILTLYNDGQLPFKLEVLTLNQGSGKPLEGLELDLLESTNHQPVSLPASVLPDCKILLRFRCRAEGLLDTIQDGILNIGSDATKPLRLAVRLDTRTPKDHPFPVGLDFGTTVSAVATRLPNQSRAGWATSLTFRPPGPDAGNTHHAYLPSDVEILHNPHTNQPRFQICWTEFDAEYHLLDARNLKRRIGLQGDVPDRFEDVFIDGERFPIPVEDLALYVIQEMKRQSERRLQARLREGMTTIPTRFSLRRVKVIQDLYERAGFDRVFLLDESVAAGILGMYHQFKDLSEYTMLVYDMGGGTTDVSLIRVENRRENGALEIHPTILGADGDPELGGRDVTDAMVKDYLEHLPEEERDTLLWPEPVQDDPELQLVAKRNHNFLFRLAESAKLAFFDNEEEDDPPEMASIQPSLFTDKLNRRPFPHFDFRRDRVEELIRPRVERLWRRVLEMLRKAEVEDLDILYLVGRSSALPLIRDELTKFLTADGRFPRLALHFPTNRDNEIILKEAVSLGACIARDLLFKGQDERLVLPPDRQVTSRFGIRDQRGEFKEVLAANSKLGQPSVKRLPLYLTPAFGQFEAELEVVENLSQAETVDDNLDIEWIGMARVRLTPEEVGPEPKVEFGMVLEEDRTLKVLVFLQDEVREVAVEP